MSLFSQSEAENLQRVAPLALRMRPRNLDEFIGQQKLLGPGTLLRRMLAARRIGSLIFFGPPGTGKTTLAELIAKETRAALRPLNAVTSGVKELREVLTWARDEVSSGANSPILFVDEIHRFNRSQQDALLPDVEAGIVNLIGATTSNPFFSVSGALLSRSRIFQLEPLASDDIVSILHQALVDPVRGFGEVAVEVDNAAIVHLATVCEGDARKALGSLEIAVLGSTERPVRLTLDLARSSAAAKTIGYDRHGDEHYDLASALIKSIRGSDPDASIYWLARMLVSGEDIRFLCRRLVILASEDIGNADPQALSLSVAAMQGCEFVGLPECQLILSQAVTYLACAPKSNAATLAIGAAVKDVKEGSLIPVPRFLRDGHHSGTRQLLGHGEGYQYSHDAQNGVAAQDYLGVPKEYYYPVNRGFEQELGQRVEELRRLLRTRS